MTIVEGDDPLRIEESTLAPPIVEAGPTPGIPQHEVIFQRHRTQLAMLTDPDKQRPEEAAARVAEFVRQGGNFLLIGGSGEIENQLFQDTVHSVVEAAKGTPIIIFPGHLGQIPETANGITGVLNYQDIFGAAGRTFSEVYPPRAQAYVTHTLNERNILSIPTLYVLCGDENTTVIHVTGIKPINTNDPVEHERVLTRVDEWLQKGIGCIFFDAGSHASSSPSLDLIREARAHIDRLSPGTILIVGGGISTPDIASEYKNVAHGLSVGTHFENHGAGDTAKFVAALQY